MLKMLLPVGLIVFSNIIYNLSTKFVSPRINPLFSLAITYTISAVVSFSVFLVKSGSIIAEEAGKLNLSTITLAISVVGLELGYIFLYRFGWKLGTGSLVANISLACMLPLIGFVLFRESFSLRQLLGMAVCIVGLILITKQS